MNKSLLQMACLSSMFGISAYRGDKTYCKVIAKKYKRKKPEFSKKELECLSHLPRREKKRFVRELQEKYAA